MIHPSRIQAMTELSTPQDADKAVHALMSTRNTKLRMVGIIIENLLDVPLQMVGECFDWGRWDVRPAEDIPPNQCSIAVACNKDYAWTGVEGVIVYQCNDIRIGCRFDSPYVGTNKTGGVVCARDLDLDAVIISTTTIDNHAGFMTYRDHTLAWGGDGIQLFTIFPTKTGRESFEKSRIEYHSGLRPIHLKDPNYLMELTKSFVLGTIKYCVPSMLKGLSDLHNMVLGVGVNFFALVPTANQASSQLAQQCNILLNEEVNALWKGFDQDQNGLLSMEECFQLVNMLLRAISEYLPDFVTMLQKIVQLVMVTCMLGPQGVLPDSSIHENTITHVEIYLKKRMTTILNDVHYSLRRELFDRLYVVCKNIWDAMSQNGQVDKSQFQRYFFEVSCGRIWPVLVAPIRRRIQTYLLNTPTEK